MRTLYWSILWATIGLLVISTPALGDLTVSVSGGGNSLEGTSSVTYNEGTLAATQDLRVNPAEGSIGNDFYFWGSLGNVAAYASDSSGNYVYLRRYVTGSSQTRGSWYWSISKGSGYITGYQRLSAYNAYSIYAYDYASNNDASSRSYLYITSSSPISTLQGYYGYARAETNLAYTSQSFNYAKGGTSIHAYSLAMNDENDYTYALAHVSNGEAYSYSSFARSRWYYAYAYLDDVIINAPSGSGYVQMYATKPDKYYSSYTDKTYSQQVVKYGSMQSPHPTAGYADYAYASRYYDKAYAYSSASYYNSYSGYSYSLGYAYNTPSGGSSSTKLSIIPSGVQRYQAYGYLSGPTYKSTYSGSF